MHEYTFMFYFMLHFCVKFLMEGKFGTCWELERRAGQSKFPNFSLSDINQGGFLVCRSFLFKPYRMIQPKKEVIVSCILFLFIFHTTSVQIRRACDDLNCCKKK